MGDKVQRGQTGARSRSIYNGLRRNMHITLQIKISKLRDRALNPRVMNCSAPQNYESCITNTQKNFPGSQLSNDLQRDAGIKSG